MPSMVRAVPTLTTQTAPRSSACAPMTASQRSTPSCAGCEYALRTPPAAALAVTNSGSIFHSREVAVRTTSAMRGPLTLLTNTRSASPPVSRMVSRSVCAVHAACTAADCGCKAPRSKRAHLIRVLPISMRRITGRHRSASCPHRASRLASGGDAAVRGSARTHAAIECTSLHVQPGMGCQPVTEPGNDAQPIANASRQRHAFAEPLVDCVDAGVAGPARLPTARAVAEPGQAHDFIEACFTGLRAHFALGGIEQRQAKAAEQLVAAIAPICGVQTHPRTVDEPGELLARFVVAMNGELHAIDAVSGTVSSQPLVLPADEALRETSLVVSGQHRICRDRCDGAVDGRQQARRSFRMPTGDELANATHRLLLFRHAGPVAQTIDYVIGLNGAPLDQQRRQQSKSGIPAARPQQRDRSQIELLVLHDRP